MYMSETKIQEVFYAKSGCYLPSSESALRKRQERSFSLRARLSWLQGGIAWEESYGGVPVIPCATLAEWKLGGRGVSWKQSRIFEDVLYTLENEIETL